MGESDPGDEKKRRRRCDRRRKSKSEAKRGRGGGDWVGEAAAAGEELRVWCGEVGV